MTTFTLTAILGVSGVLEALVSLVCAVQGGTRYLHAETEGEKRKAVHLLFWSGHALGIALFVTVLAVGLRLIDTLSM